MSGQRIADIWVYLSAAPLLWLTATLLAYLAAFAIHRRGGFHPLLNPVPIAVAIIVALLWASDTRFETYFAGAQFVHFLLGPATVALAVPLWDQRHRVRRMGIPLAAGLAAGVTTAVVSATAIAWVFGASRETIFSLAPKSVTTPVAMAIAERVGGLPSLTATLVIATGILGAMIARPVLDRTGVTDPAARGFALGVTSHGIGTARAFQVGEVQGAFAGLAMALAALVTSLVVPLLGWAFR
jgi:predicted murein hydrolase (TIGR00659 family)